MALEREIATYEKRLAELVPDEGKFVLICGETLAGVYEAYSDAIKAGYEKFGLNPFLVKQIEAVETVQFLTRDIGICRT